jgi:hypothetical protein
MNVEKAPTLKIDYKTICFEAKCALHRMSMGDKSNIIDEAETFLCTIWLEELRGIYWEEHWAYNHELLCCKLWDACLDDWIVFKKTDDNIYLKSIVSTGGKSMTDWQSKMRLNTRKLLDGCWQNTHNQSNDNSLENLGDGWFVQLLYDELSNTILGSMVKFEK